jgi:hypothetical protein
MAKKRKENASKRLVYPNTVSHACDSIPFQWPRKENKSQAKELYIQIP